MKEYKDVILYKLARPIITFFFKLLYRPKIVGVENIPKTGKVILAGNHTNNFDSVFLMSSTKRNIHFLAKIELSRGIKKIIFNNLGLIFVDRSKKSNEGVIDTAKQYLETDLVIGIFPEGTTEKGCGYLLPFKIGAVKLSYDTDTEIIPFKISGDYKLFSKNLKIIFEKPYKANNDLENSNKKLYNIINNIKDV